MTYTRVRPRNNRRNISKSLRDDKQIDLCPIPSSVLNTFIEENPNAGESVQIEALLEQSMIPVFNEDVPNLVNTCPEKMAEYRAQRQLVDKIKFLKRQKKKHYDRESPGLRFSFSSEPFFTVLVKVMSSRKPSKNQIKDNLQHLGRIEDIVLFDDGYDYQFAFVRFESSEVAFNLSQNWNQIKFNYGLVKNVAIRVFPKRPLCCTGGYELLAYMKPIDRQLLIEEVRNSLQSGQHFDKMKELLLLSENDRQNRLSLCHKLESILNNNQIGCKFHVFGSSVNELGFCNSDIDVFIEITDENNVTLKMDSNLGIEYLIKIRELLGKELRMFIRPTIMSRRCPLVKLDFRHFGDSLRENGISCDLSLVQSLGLQNSKLMAFFCKIAPKFQTLAVVLRYLAKINGFIGSSQMSSYAFSMLIVFFCQSLSVPLLPSVDELIELKTKCVTMSGIDCGFCDDIDRYRQKYPLEWDECSLNCLLILFFEFFSNFDFKCQVICPLSGQIVLKSKFVHYLGDLGVRNVQEFQMTDFICIQDPFDLTFNMTHHMPYKLFLELRAWFRKVSTHSHEYFSEEYSEDPNVRTFADLLLNHNNQPIEDLKKQMENDINTNDNGFNDIQIIERVISKHLIAKLSTNFEPNVADEEIDTKLEDWVLKVSHFFRILFREAFKMKCIYDSKFKSKIKLNENNTFESFLIKFNTIDRRIIDTNVRQLAENNMTQLPFDFVKRETKITESVLEDGEHCLIIDDNSEEIRIELELSFEQNNQIFLNVTNIKPQNDSQLTKGLIKFICDTFRSGLEAEQLLTIDDDICIVLN